MCPSESHSLTRRIARSTLQELRCLLRRVGFLRSGWNLSRTLVEIGRNTWVTPARFEREFHQPDPWGYFSKSRQQERLRRAAQMLEKVRKTLKIGCAERDLPSCLLRYVNRSLRLMSRRWRLLGRESGVADGLMCGATAGICAETRRPLYSTSWW
jgi:hypothetical protein